MSHFIMICRDKPASLALRMVNRPAHLDWAKSHEDRIAMAGPIFADDGETFIGSVFVVEAASREEVELWAAEDPYLIAGLFETIEIHPFRWVFGSGPAK